MNNELKPYPFYRDSGLRWLGDVPEHWKTERAKWLFNRMERPVSSFDETVTCFRDGTVTLRKNRRLRGFTESLKEIGYQGVRKGDLVIHIMDAAAGAIGVSDSDGKCTPVYIICEPKQEINPYYYSYLIREMSRTQWIIALARGIRERSTDFRYDVFGNQRVAVPHISEQNAIVHFIEYYDQFIRRYIHNQRQQIGHLNEQKQAIIQNAVTGGLHTSAQLRPSGTDWLGDIPSHWDVLRSKFIFREIDKRSTTGNETHLSMSQKLGLVPSSMIEERRLMSESYVGAKICEKDDIVLNRLKAHLGVFALAPQQGLVSPDYTIFRASRKINPRYFELLLRTPACRVELRKRAKGIVQGFWRLYTDDFYDIRLSAPPIEEQNTIVAYLDDELRELNRAIEKINDEVELIREYRTRLISDVVTGKIDVREAAKNLPEIETLETAESELSEEDELSDDLEETEEMSNADE